MAKTQLLENSVQCKQCGHGNPEDNNFCGHCGSPLQHHPAAAEAPDLVTAAPPQPAQPGRGEDRGGTSAERSAASAPEPVATARVNNSSATAPLVEERREPVPISGPSFLGLADTPGENRSLGYLYEDEPRHWGRAIFALLLLAGLGVFLAHQWKQLPSWYATIVKPQTVAIPTPPPPAAPPVTAQTPPPVAEQAAPPATPQPGDNAPSSTAPAAGDNKDVTASVAVNGKGNTAGEATAATTADKDASAAAPEKTAEDNRRVAQPARTAKREKRSTVQDSEASTQRSESDLLLTKGQAYLYGKGEPRSCTQALVYVRKAADLSNPKAYSQLGALYATGHCVPLDRAQAYKWFTKAKDAGASNEWIDQNRQMLWSQMTGAERQRAVREHLY